MERRKEGNKEGKMGIICVPKEETRYTIEVGTKFARRTNMQTFTVKT
jgi:hypothetical protein